MPIPHPEPARYPELSLPGLISPLIHIHDRAIWYHRQAIQALQAGDYPAATTWNNQALALYVNNAAFHALAGQLWALYRGVSEAALAGKARHLNPQHPTANAYLQGLEEIASPSLNHEESVTNLPVSDYSWYAPDITWGKGATHLGVMSYALRLRRLSLALRKLSRRHHQGLRYQSSSLHT